MSVTMLKDLRVSAAIRVAARHPSFHSAFLQHSEHNINHFPEFFTQNKIIHGCVDAVRRRREMREQSINHQH